MGKTDQKPSRRAYINPIPGYSESEQRADILRTYVVNEWYVESRTIKRADFIQHLRAGDQAIVAQMGCLAKATGRIDSVMYDLADARGDIHAKGCIILDADGLRSDKDWLAAKAAARDFRARKAQGAKSSANGSTLKFVPTNAQVKTYLRIADSRRYKNWNQRAAAIKAEGLPEVGRTWFVEKLKIIARERGLEL